MFVHYRESLMLFYCTTIMLADHCLLFKSNLDLSVEYTPAGQAIGIWTYQWSILQWETFGRAIHLAIFLRNPSPAMVPRLANLCLCGHMHAHETSLPSWSDVLATSLFSQ